MASVSPQYSIILRVEIDALRIGEAVEQVDARGNKIGYSPAETEEFRTQRV
jgi:hypothetical protein